MRRLPALNSIRAFESAARHQSFTLAAAELSVTVTAISHQVRQLEACIGHKLFERQGRVVVLTTVGNALYPSLREGFDQIAEAFLHVTAPSDGQSIRLSTTRAFAERWLVPRLGRFNDLYPDLIVHLHGSEKVEDLGAEGYDLAIRYGPKDRTDQEGVILEDRFIAVADHALFPDLHGSSIDGFRERPLLAYRWSNPAMAAPSWSNWLQGQHRSNDKDFRISWYSDETLALHAAGRGLGPLLCSDVLIDEQLRSGQMRQIDGPSLPGFAYRLIERSTHKRSVRRFIDWLKQEALEQTSHVV